MQSSWNPRLTGWPAIAAVALSALLPGTAAAIPIAPWLAQVANPADARPRAEDASALDEDTPANEHRSWLMPEVIVEGERPRRLREEHRVGVYQQPRWTATRRFPATRVYVVPQGKVEFEYWLRPTFDQNRTEMRSLWEVEFGLPHRFQLDLYLRTDQDGDEQPMQLGQQVEVRWAFADWGKVWGNPTLYLEWVGLEERPDKIEPKLLLGGELSEGWHWGVNGVAELELGGEREYEYNFTGGLSHTVVDEKFSLGVETVLAWADVAADRGDFSENLMLGPSMQVRPLPQMSVNVAPVFGLTADSADARIYINTGWEF